MVDILVNAERSLMCAIFCVKTSNSKCAWGNPDDLPKRRHLSAHFGLKYLSNDDINRDRFYCQNFPKIHTFRTAEKMCTGLILSVPLNYVNQPLQKRHT